VVNCFAFDGTTILCRNRQWCIFSTDEGDSWTPISTGLTTTEIKALTIWGTNVYAATYEGVFTTDKTTINWVLTTAGMSNSEVNSVTANNGIIYASTNGGVYSMVDNAISWAPANTGYAELQSVPLYITVSCMPVHLNTGFTAAIQPQP
jgi:hypothetical protein